MDNSKYILPHFKFPHKGAADEKAVIQGEKYRFTVLTDRLIRMEYSQAGVFEDRPSQTFWFRNQEIPAYTVKDMGESLEITTEYLSLSYSKEEPFTRGTLMIKMSTQNVGASGVWRYGFEEAGNFKGTYRTLDGQDGKLVLDKGLISSEGYTVFDDSYTKVFDDNGWIQERIQGNVDLYFFGYGNDYKGCIRDFYKVSGNTPLLPRYALGNWWSRYWTYTEEELKELILDFEKRAIPLSVCIIDMDWHVTDISQRYGSGWTGYTWNKELFPDPEAFLKWLKSKHLYTSLNLHPALGIRGHEECYKDAADFMGIDADKDELIPFDCTDPRFMNAYFTKVHNPHEEKGCDFWWIDWQQGNNTAVEGLDPLWMLNHLHFLDLGRNKNKRPFIFSRWPGLGGHRYPIGFSGDTVVSWESLEFQPEFTATAANVGYGWWSHDIGGHFFGAEDPELYTRWVQFGVFSPIMRLHTSKNYYNKREPWKWNKNVEEITTKYMQLRHQLIPYLYTMSKRNESYGMPLITPMYYENSNDHRAYEAKEQYYFGSELMAAPYLKPMHSKLNKAKRRVWFPKGIWFDFFNGEVYEGDKAFSVYGSLEEMPVYAKAGAIIPLAKLLKSNQHDNPEALEVHIFPGDSNQFDLYEDDGLSLAYKDGKYVITSFETRYSDNSFELLIEAQGELSIMPNNRTIEIKFRSITDKVSVECSTPFKQSYDKENKTLAVTLATYNAAEKISIKLTTTENALIDDSFDYIQKVMKLLDESTYETQQKEKIGFVYSRYAQLRRGILAKEADVKQKALEILAEDIDLELKEAVLSILLRAK